MKSGVKNKNNTQLYGSIVSETGGREKDITSWIAKVRATFAQLRPVWLSRKLTQKIKFKIVCSKTWKVTNDISCQIQDFHQLMLTSHPRYLLARLSETISNVEIFEIKRNSDLRFFLKIRNLTRSPKIYLFLNPNHKKLKIQNTSYSVIESATTRLTRQSHS